MKISSLVLMGALAGVPFATTGCKDTKKDCCSVPQEQKPTPKKKCCENKAEQPKN